MSIRGRYIIDRLKHTTLFSQYLQLPVPPYENPNYWENIYRTLGSNDTYEWGNIQYNDLIQYQYEHYYNNHNNNDTASHTTTTTNPMIKWLLSSNILQYSDNSSSDNDPTKKTMTTTFHETMGLKNPKNNKISNNNGQQQEQHKYAVYNNNDIDPSIRRKHEMELKLKQQKEKEEPILILGCGNSQFGENMMEHHNQQQQSNDNSLLYVGPIIQMDVSSRVIDSMSYRCNMYIETGDMIFIQDDATILSSLNDNTIQCTFDKGLLDALYCSNDYIQCYQIMNTVHRVLKTNTTNNTNSDGIFSFLSFTNPEFLLNKLLIPPSSSISSNNDIQYYKYQQQIVSKQQQHKIITMWSNIQIRKLESIYLYRFTKCNRDNNQQQQQRHHQSTNMLHPTSRITPSSPISVGKKRQKR